MRAKSGGRKLGTPNRFKSARRMMAEAGISVALSSGISPLEVILAKMRGGPDAAAITDSQLQAAIAAAPYVHPRLNATSVTGSITTSPLGSHDDRMARLDALRNPPGLEIDGEAEEEA